MQGPGASAPQPLPCSPAWQLRPRTTQGSHLRCPFLRASQGTRPYHMQNCRPEGPRKWCLRLEDRVETRGSQWSWGPDWDQRPGHLPCGVFPSPAHMGSPLEWA